MTNMLVILDWVFHEAPVGSHAYSLDGVTWHMSEAVTYNTSRVRVPMLHTLFFFLVAVTHTIPLAAVRIHGLCCMSSLLRL